MRRAKAILGSWLPIAAATTVLCFVAYVMVQQTFRHAANDPQIQMAEAAAEALSRGEPVESVVSSTAIDVARSLSPFVTVVDDGGRPVASSGSLHGRAAVVPNGVLDFARRHGEHRVTWQPEPGVRIASVVVRYGGASPGFVIAGRSLRETENRIAQIGQLALLGWIAALVTSLIAAAVAGVTS